MNAIRNARFWDGINCDRVKITLRPGQTLSWSERHLTDEGYSMQAVTYTLRHDGTLLCDTVHGGRDCDGVCTDSAQWMTTLDKILLHELTSNETLPPWERVSGSRYDEYAQAMGY